LINYLESEKSISEGEIASIDSSQSIHDGLVNVGELDQLPIYLMTNTKVFNSPKDVGLTPPSIELLKNMYDGLREAFTSYSEQVIMNYVYSLEPVPQKLSSLDMINVVKNDYDESKEQTGESKSLYIQYRSPQ
jgi:hypothetical protein